MEKENSVLRITATHMEDLTKGSGGEMESLILDGLKVVELKHGLIRCDFVVPSCASDDDGNWHVGAIATAMDSIGAVAVYTGTGGPHVSVDLTVSYFSEAAIQEKVEIEAKVVGANKTLKSATIEVRKKDGQGLIALGKLWMAPVNPKLIKNNHFLSKL